MKITSLLFISLIFFSCKSLEELKEEPQCPKGYECNAEVIANKTLLILEDSIKKIYPKLEDSDDFHVVKYTFKYEGQPEIADDTYVETIYFQIPQDAKNLTLSGKGLAKVKLMAQKSCFCPDAGYELIKNGNLNVEKHKNSFRIKLKYDSERNMRVNSLQTTVEIKA